MKKAKDSITYEEGKLMTTETAGLEESVEAKDKVRFKLAPKGCIVSVLEEHRYYGKSNESIAEMIFDLLDKNGYTITEKFSCERASED